MANRPKQPRPLTYRAYFKGKTNKEIVEELYLTKPGKEYQRALKKEVTRRRIPYRQKMQVLYENTWRGRFVSGMRKLIWR